MRVISSLFLNWFDGVQKRLCEFSGNIFPNTTNPRIVRGKKLLWKSSGKRFNLCVLTGGFVWEAVVGLP
jgi:hypothetical protein